VTRAALLLALLLALPLLVLPSTAAAQGVPDCDPAIMLGVALTSEEEGFDGVPPVATHEIVVKADFTGGYPSRVKVTPPQGVRQIATSGENTSLIAPNAASVQITVSWRQSRDPSDPYADPNDPATGCAASQVMPVALLGTNPSHAVKTKLWKQLVRSGFSDVGIVPALKRPDLSPLEVSARTTSRVAFPPASAKPRTMAVPMRSADQVKYRTRLPNKAYMTVPQACRFYYLTCATPFGPGGVFTEVSRLYLDDRALNRGIEKGDVNGSLDLLARSQPSKISARYGVMVEARPGSVREGHPRPFGYDVQVHQSGRLIARLRQAGRCVQNRLPQGLVVQCRIARSSYQLH
jgi:hypothetical protein